MAAVLSAQVARPAAAERDSWFNLMAIHQNRLPRGAGVTMKGYIKEALLPNCMDLVVWGHEHECTIEGGMYAVPESAEVPLALARTLAAVLGRVGRGPCTGWCLGGAAHSAAAGTSRALACHGEAPCQSRRLHKGACTRRVVRHPRAVRACASQNQFTVIQPGSTVATSLVEGEAKPKHVALLSIKDDNWKMESIPLTTVRPFLLREVVLADHADDYELQDERTLMDMLGKQARRGRGLGGGQTRLPTRVRHACTCSSPPSCAGRRDAGGGQGESSHAHHAGCGEQSEVPPTPPQGHDPPPTPAEPLSPFSPLSPLSPLSPFSPRSPLSPLSPCSRRLPPHAVDALAASQVDYTGFTTCNPQRFGQRFVDKASVALPAPSLPAACMPTCLHACMPRGAGSHAPSARVQVANPSELLLFQRKAKKEDKADKKKEGARNADPERDQDRDPAVQIQARLAGPRVALVSRSRPLLPPHATAATPLAPRLGALPWPHPGSVPSARPPCPAPHLCRTAPLFPLVRTWWAASSEEARSSFDCCRRHALSLRFRAWPGLPVTSAMVSSTRPIGPSTCLCCGGAGGSRHRCLRWLRLQGDEDGDPGPGREVAQADAGVAQQRAPRPHQPGHGPQVQGERDREVRARACSRVWRRCGCRRRRRGRPGRAAGASSRRAPPHALTPASRPARTTALCIGRVGHRPGHRGGATRPGHTGCRSSDSLPHPGRQPSV